MRKVCEWCGKYFVTKSKVIKYCCKDCKKKASESRANKKAQLCWTCHNATGGCLWSRELKPVKGWDAKRTVNKDSEGYKIYSYKIRFCPQYIHD